MTPIDLEAEYIDEFTSLTDEVNDTRLVYISGIQFAILGPINSNLFAFESIALADYVGKVRRNFESFRFVKTRKGAGAGQDDQIMLFIWATGRHGILLTEGDEILKVETIERSPADLSSATKAFGFPPNGHLARMLMTARLVQKVESVSEGHGTTIEQILYLMYRDSAKACCSKSNQKNSQTVAGEHFIFETRPFNDHLTVFDLVETEA